MIPKSKPGYYIESDKPLTDLVWDFVEVCSSLTPGELHACSQALLSVRSDSVPSVVASEGLPGVPVLPSVEPLGPLEPL